MELKQVQSRLDYLNNLKLATVSDLSDKTLLSVEPTFDDDLPGAKTVAGSTVSFTGGVPKIRQQDVLNSTLLAQLAANYAFDRESETEQWYTKYKEVLENVGWIIQNFQFNRYNSSGTTVKMDKSVLDIMAAAMSGNELVILKATIDALRNGDPDSKEITLFDTNGSTGENGNFQLSTASLDPNDNIQMSLGAFYFKATEHHTRFLFWSWSSKSLNMYSGAQSVLLNEEIYKTVRSAITTKLGDKAVKYVADIPIG